jgi:hypothetical protein
MALSVLSHRNGVVPKPNAEHATASESVVVESPTSIEEGATAVPFAFQVFQVFQTYIFRCLI